MLTKVAHHSQTPVIDILIFDEKRHPLLVDRLVHEGLRIQEVNDLIGAYTAWEQKNPYLILLGFPMRDGQGKIFLTRLREHKNKIELPVLTMMDDGRTDLLGEAFASGANDFSIHPFGSELIQHILSLHRTSSHIQTLFREFQCPDPLTGLCPQGFLLDRLTTEAKRVSRDGLPLTLMIIELDSFAFINKSWGRLAGEAALRFFAETIRATCRETDVAGRLGRSCFALILPNTTHNGAMVLGQNLLSAVKAIPFLIKGERFFLRASIGVTTQRFTAYSLADIKRFASATLKQATRAIRLARQGGGNQLVHYLDVVRQGKRLVIIDDDQKRSVPIKHALETAGYQVFIVSSAKKAIPLIRRKQIGYLLVQMFLSGVHGFSALQNICDDPYLDGVRMVVYADKEYLPEVEKARELGASGFWCEKTDIGELLKLMEDHAAPFYPPLLKAKGNKTKHLTQRSAKGPPPQKVVFKFWGTRGSLPVSGAENRVFGGNTICLEIHDEDHTLIVDTGSGCRQLGTELLKRRRNEYCILIGHAHWDHLQGFPFFVPAYTRGNVINVLGPSGMTRSFRSLMGGLMDLEYFPTPFESMAADMLVDDLVDQRFFVGHIEVSWIYMNHPGITAGFKFRFKDHIVVYITDNELRCIDNNPAHGLDPDKNKEILSFVQDADTIIHEAQFLDEEYTHKVGWGHSSVSAAAELAVRGRARQWLISHHDPFHNDVQLIAKEDLCKQAVHKLKGRCEVRCLKDGDEVVLG